MFDRKEPFVAFFGKAETADVTVTLTPQEGKDYVGYYTTFTVDPVVTPKLRITVRQAAGPGQLTMDLDGQEFVLADDLTAGTREFDLADALPAGPRDTKLMLRASGLTVIDAIELLTKDGAPPPERIVVPASEGNVPLCLRVPVKQASEYRVAATSSQEPAPVEITETWSGGVELRLQLTGRTVVRLCPR